MTHHTLDVHPLPKEISPLYVNEPWLIDLSYLEQAQMITDLRCEPDQKKTELYHISLWRGNGAKRNGFFSRCYDAYFSSRDL